MKFETLRYYICHWNIKNQISVKIESKRINFLTKQKCISMRMSRIIIEIVRKYFDVDWRFKYDK